MLFYVIILVPNAPPQNVQVDVTSVYTASVSWAPPPADQQNGIIRSYTIRLTNVVTRERLEFIATSSSTTYQLTSLQANTQYSVAVAATTRVGTGPFSQSVTLETGTTSEHITSLDSCIFIANWQKNKRLTSIVLWLSLYYYVNLWNNFFILLQDLVLHLGLSQYQFKVQEVSY